MIRLANELENVKTVAVAGHIRPDGDCIGSCLAVYSYLQENFPEISVDVYLEMVNPNFLFLKGADQVKISCEEDRGYDLFIALDASEKERLGGAAKYFETAGKTLCIDHHITNPGFAEQNWVDAQASSTAELVYQALEEDKISKETAEAVYLGIIHDTGVFQYSNTTPRTMQIAGRLMAKGIDFSRIIEDTFYRKTYVQNQVLGRALMESILLLDGKIIVGRIRQKDMSFYGVGPADLEGIVSQLRADNKTIVVTNGCFDILHVGHVRYLKETKTFADKLIVLVNSDKSVRQIKGEGRPINSENDRAEVLCALSAVDYVVLFDETSPAALIDEIKPDIYTKGGDYTLETLPEYDVIMKNNIEVKFIKFVDGKSTTGIIKKINNK